ncbi:RagB/SusD family nutrient uptake outer membrane protein [Thalassobellus suaedae]|uniref:RagB/SusD family nutrient uptake outer membrane protein n=1 Tax=Thalassobellus suaedae TaxID=3074124 RepID=A0ABY9Y0P7_9FLAO|nr:RagB/SusD family nutrient uptake outer membrane protein [Flavobacteriaceae bacterium HL-DH10]
MKTKILYIVLAFSMVACSDFLEIDSETDLSNSTFFQTPEDYVKAVNGVYAPLRESYNKSAYVMGELRSDNSYYDYNSENRGQNPPEFIADFLETSTNVNIQAKWDNDFYVISRANKVLASIDDVEFDDSSLKDNLKGQALFLRALSYFDLVQYFGDVPLHLDPVTTLEGTALPLSTTEVIYKQIMDDVKLAETLLPNKTNQEPGRATSGSAKTLLGNVYMVLKMYSQAATVLQEVVDSKQYSLILTSYADVFDPSNKNNSESIFEVQYLEGSAGYNSNFIYQFMPQPITAEEVAQITGVSNAQSIGVEGFNLPTPDLIASYEAGDLRKDATINYINISATGMLTPYVAKYNHAHSQFNNTNDNWPVYRYSEVLLSLAEALNESDSGDPLTPLNKVRNRAGLGNVVTTDKAQLRDIILHERRVELAFENKRWLDLVRTGNADAVMKAFGDKVKANPQDYYFPVGTNPISSSYTTINTLFPLPSREVILNPNY